jgi:hypothetical protein
VTGGIEKNSLFANLERITFGATPLTDLSNSSLRPIKLERHLGLARCYLKALHDAGAVVLWRPCFRERLPAILLKTDLAAPQRYRFQRPTAMLLMSRLGRIGLRYWQLLLP